ncbi:unnamed protein product [Prunus armeniaca]
MWLGNEPSNWETNSQPARTTETLKARMPVTSPMRANYPIKGLQQHPVKDAPGFDNSKYLKFPYPSSKSGELPRVAVAAAKGRNRKREVSLTFWYQLRWISSIISTFWLAVVS